MPKTIKLRPAALDDDLPLHPAVARRVREMSEGDGSRCSEDDLLLIVGADPALAARALRVASAPVFGHGGAVSTLSQVLSVVGPDPLRSLAVGIANRRGTGSGDGFAEWWAHALHCAAIARALAEKLGYHSPEEAYVAGLLHDVGKGYMAVAALSGSDFTPLPCGAPASRERAAFGTTHEEVGAAVAKRWNLAPSLHAALRYHHAAEAKTSKLGSRDRSLVGIVAAADALAHSRRGTGAVGASSRMGFEPAESLGLPAASLRSTCNAAEAALLDVAKRLGVVASRISDLYSECVPTRSHRVSVAIAATETREVGGLPSLLDVLHDLRTKSSFAQVIETSLEALRSRLGFDRATFLEKARHGRTYRAIRIEDGARQRARAALRLAPGPDDAAIGRCLATRRAHIAADAKRDATLLEHFGAAEIGLAPVTSRGQVVGLLAVDNFASRAPIGDRELALVEVLAGEAGILLDNHTLQSQERLLKEFAEKDAITGISNRRYAIELGRKEVDRAKRYGTPLSLVMLDLDDFKELNDRYGHLAGDRVISEVARILAGNSRRTDVLGRYGGDEFMALLPEIGREQALAYAERMRSRVEEFARKLEPEYSKVSLSISVGVSTLQPGAKLEDLIQAADAALYAAKDAGKNRVCVNG